MSDPKLDPMPDPQPDPMPDPTAAGPDDALLRRFLLGTATAEEVEHVERYLFAELEALARIEALEADLLDAAARGALPPAEHDQVLGRLASSRAGRARLAFARDLVEVADGNSETQPGLLPVVSLAPPARRQRPRARWMFRAAAAGAVIAAGAATLWLGLPTGGARAPGIVARALPVPGAQAGLATAILELSLATSRGSGPLPILRLAPGTRRVELRIQLEVEESYRMYRATLHGAAGRTLAVARSLTPRATATGPEIAFDLDAAELKPGRYEVTVEGELTGTEPELVGAKEFAVMS